MIAPVIPAPASEREQHGERRDLGFCYRPLERRFLGKHRDHLIERHAHFLGRGWSVVS